MVVTKHVPSIYIYEFVHTQVYQIIFIKFIYHIIENKWIIYWFSIVNRLTFMCIFAIISVELRHCPIYIVCICNKMRLGYGIEVGTWPHLFLLLLLQINCNEKITFMVALVEFVPIYKNLLHTKSAYNGRHSTEMCGYEIYYVSFPPFSHKWVIYAQECHKYWLVKPY